MGVRRGVKRELSPLETGTKKQTFLENVNKQFFPISWVNYCNGSLFADVMTLTLHKSQFAVLV